MRSSGKTFMKFGRMAWKILAFKVGKISFFKHWIAISDDFDHRLWKVFALWILNLKYFVLKN